MPSVKLAETELAEEYARAQPFPHVVLDGLFDAARLERVADEFPAPDDPRWKTYGDAGEAGKQDMQEPERWGPEVSALVDELSAPPWLDFVGAITGCDDLVASPHGGGMHQSGPGASLDVHVDFNRHPDQPLQRLVNLILYLNPGWTEADGSCLELWTETERARSIVPVFNRCVLFEASDRSFHGHPVPVAPGRLRRSIALYYYGRTGTELPEEHDTVWLEAR
jgi:hypothetical protein